jgi:hypothetical protein
MALYALIHDPAGDRVASYDGIDQPTVTGLLNQTGFTFAFIDAPTYAAFILAHQPVPLTPAQILTLVHTQAVATATTGTDPLSTLQRAVLLALLDQLNIVRAALPTPLGAITPAQARAAIAAKINTNAAD